VNLVEIYALCNDLKCLYGKKLTGVLPCAFRNIYAYMTECNWDAVDEVTRIGTSIVIKMGDTRLLIDLESVTSVVLSQTSKGFCDIPDAHTVLRFSEACLTISYDNPQKSLLSLYEGQTPDEFYLGHDLFDIRLTAEYLDSKRGIHAGIPLNKFLLKRGVCAYIDSDYLSEALHVANTFPFTYMDTVNTDDRLRIFDTVIRALRFVYSRSLDCFYDGGRKVNPDSFFNIYGHGGDQCPACGTYIELFDEIFWCRECQAEGALCNGV